MNTYTYKDNKLSELEELKIIWYQRLKDSGFDDLEENKRGRSAYQFERVSGLGSRWPVLRNKFCSFEFYRILGIYIQHCDKVKKRHKKVLEYYAESGDMPEAIKKSKIKIKEKAMYMYVLKNFKKMRDFVSKLEEEARREDGEELYKGFYHAGQG